ncbi:hypothetical protein NPIL_564621 [Nephila pilipes]|uniref:Uncharacterized protein n=1 Tax=Nephila pilipes TaxID=299642 RepID=A0A8X6PR16_NEPPI|nr:hypothetical protein NPIL_564621 [Nephila pilipes]
MGNGPFVNICISSGFFRVRKMTPVARCVEGGQMVFGYRKGLQTAEYTFLGWKQIVVKKWKRDILDSFFHQQDYVSMAALSRVSWSENPCSSLDFLQTLCLD